MKNTLIIGGIVILLLAGGAWWSRSLGSSNEGNVLSTNGLHWHPTIAIYVDGQKQDIPANIGLIGGHRPIHTHDPDGVIHLEFSGRVTRKDIKLKNFFAIWGKDMTSFGEQLTMTVNGKENTELGEYEMQDGDVIELRYE